MIHGLVEAVALDEGRYVAYFIDQTEQRKLRTQLQQVQKIESVGRLAAGVAHDFNNMLSPILGYAELLLEDLPTGTECYGYSLEIKNAAERSRNLIRQLLAFSRKQVLSLDTLDLRETVSGMQDLFLTTISNKMNEVMKVLTIIATIFIPLTFIAGIYGMNFNPEISPFNMPELNARFGYIAAWAVMIVTALAMVLYFKRKKWL